MIYYKVTTKHKRSLGLKRNPTILNFKIGEWTLSPNVTHGEPDLGGIWVATTLSSAKKLYKYMLNKYNMVCLIYEVKIGDMLYSNNYRTKTDKVKLTKRILYN